MRPSEGMSIDEIVRRHQRKIMTLNGEIVEKGRLKLAGFSVTVMKIV